MLDDRDPVTQEEADAALTDPAVEPEPAAEPAAEPEGQPRDEQGRFTAEPPSPEPEPAAAEAAPEVETPPEPTEAPPEAEAESYPGFTYRADSSCARRSTSPGWRARSAVIPRPRVRSLRTARSRTGRCSWTSAPTR